MIYQELGRFIEEKKPFALVAVIEKIGSGPASLESRMAVSPDQSIGTIGGGTLEAKAKDEAMMSLKDGKPRISHYILREDGNVDLICGGEVKLLIKPFLPESKDYKLMEIAIQLIKENKSVCMSFLLSPFAGTYLYSEDRDEYSDIPEQIIGKVKKLCSQIITKGKSQYFESSEFTAFFEAITGSPEIILFGAGHVSYYLSKIVSMLGFSITVIDDRPEYANKERFPEAKKIITGDYEGILEKIKPNNNTYVVIQTRSHELDRKILGKIIHSDAKYIGMIGSKRKVRKIFETLKKDGIPENLLKRVKAPIGLDIGSETPPEIAVSIAAQIIMERKRDNLFENYK